MELKTYEEIWESLSEERKQKITEKTLKFIQELEEYMALEKHDAECMCVRCMSEFYGNVV